MKQEKKNNYTKKAIYFAIGTILIVGTFAGSNLKYITDWSTSELVGSNVFSIFAIFMGPYLVYLGVKR